MKKNIFLLLSLFLVTLSCQKEIVPSLSLNQTEITISNEGGTQSISFESNVNWTAKSSESWCTISPASGEASTKSITVTVATNESYDARSCTVTIMAGGVSKAITINQSPNLGLLVTKDKYDLTNDANTIEVEVKANIVYDVTISEDWITQVTTRGLTSTTLQFNIAKNSSYDNRDGSITIKQKGGSLSSTIIVHQSQEDAIIISNKREDISNSPQTLDVELKTNVDFEVVIPETAKSWVTYISTRALRTEIVSLNIKRNNDDEVRSTDIYIKNKETSFQDTLKITQDANEPNVYWVDKMGTLSTVLNQTQKDTITTMIVKGEISSADFSVMKSNMPELKYLDLKDVKCEGNQIPLQAFRGKDITTIIFPLSITSIGMSAFNDCTGLTGSLNLPTGLKSIGQFAFNGCTGLTGSLNLPTGLTKIEDAVFQNCSGFNGTLTIPAGVTSIGDWAFNGCSGFTGSLTLPNELKSIGKTVFQDCSGFTGSLTIPAGVTTIKEWTFNLCSGLNGSLTLPAGLTSIGNNAFAFCSELTGLSFPNGLTKIERNAFFGCSNISGDINFPISLNSIGEFGFYGCAKVNAFIFSHNIPFPYNTYMLQPGAKVIVPSYSVAAYKNADGWKNHNIVGRSGSPSGSFTDPRDGNVYQTVTIGNQVWMAENLKYLPSVVGPATLSRTSPYYYVYGYNGTDVNVAKAEYNYSVYGVLYNSSAAMAGSAGSNTNPSQVQGICPTGWHLPSDREWTQLTDFLGGENVAGGKLTEVGIGYFSALRGGFSGGAFSNIGKSGFWWSATEDGAFNAVGRGMGSGNSVSIFSTSNEDGLSVRCVRD